MSELIRLTDVTKVYQGGITGALSGVTLAIEKGEFVAVMGPSGSGKSTLLNLVAGLDRPTSGTIQVGDVDLGQLGEAGLARFRRDQVGFVFQFFYLLPNLTALENVLIPAQLKGMTANSQALELMHTLGIADVADRYPARLSGGQQQRVAIARALVNQPQVLLADEPTGNLDEHTGQEVLGLFQQLNRDLEQTIILVTHDSNVAACAPRRVFVRDGRIASDVTQAPPSDQDLPVPSARPSANGTGKAVPSVAH